MRQERSTRRQDRRGPSRRQASMQVRQDPNMACLSMACRIIMTQGVDLGNLVPEGHLVVLTLEEKRWAVNAPTGMSSRSLCYSLAASLCGLHIHA